MMTSRQSGSPIGGEGLHRGRMYTKHWVSLQYGVIKVWKWTSHTSLVWTMWLNLLINFLQNTLNGDPYNSPPRATFVARYLLRVQYQMGVETAFVVVLGVPVTGFVESSYTLERRHNELDDFSNHRCIECLISHWFKHRSKKTPKLCVIGLCDGNSPLTGEFPAQRSINAENVSIWWRHHKLDPAVPVGIVLCHWAYSVGCLY